MFETIIGPFAIEKEETAEKKLNLYLYILWTEICLELILKKFFLAVSPLSIAKAPY
jgi:hypothetical protein